MRSSSTITLFSSDRPEISQQPTSFVVSILLHGAVVCLLSYGIMSSRAIVDPTLSERYMVRHLNLHQAALHRSQPASRGIGYPSRQAMAQTHLVGTDPSGQPENLPDVPQLTPGPQTLVQPNLTSKLKLTEKIPVPNVVIWTPEKKLAKEIVAPQPHPPTAAKVTPSLERPNEEMDLSDLAVTSANMSSQVKPVAPGTTSPLVVNGPKLIQMAPVATSEASTQPPPAAVMSLSNLRMPDGTVSLPPINETARAKFPGKPAAGPSEAQKGKAGETGTGKGNADSGDKSPGVNRDSRLNEAMAGSSSGIGLDSVLSVEHITLPKDGQFGVVVVGSSLQEKYPETAGVWAGRLAYTVYLHVGLAKSWVLQYSLPRATEAEAAGNIERIEAPWPYNIVRPNISPGEINADALMVHGFVNQAGRFEGLAIAFPPEFSLAQFVLGALQQWQFRPAMQNGKNAKVEVLLIIPEVQ